MFEVKHKEQLREGNWTCIDHFCVDLDESESFYQKISMAPIKMGQHPKKNV